MRLTQYGYIIGRVGLAIVFVYAGISSLLSPSDWLGYLPTTTLYKLNIVPELALATHAVFEIILGLILITGWSLQFIAAIAALDILVILGVNGVNQMTFRDIGLLALAIQQALSAQPKNR